MGIILGDWHEYDFKYGFAGKTTNRLYVGEIPGNTFWTSEGYDFWEANQWKYLLLFEIQRWKKVISKFFKLHYLPLDMDYFLNEDDEFGEDFPGAKGFYIF